MTHETEQPDPDIEELIDNAWGGDSLRQMQELPPNCVDLVFGSPPYEDARTYGIDFRAKGEEWVEWFTPFVLEAVRISRGLVAFVVEGKTRKFRWSATPALLMADLHRAGVHLRKPPAFHRVGIPGSGGPDWLRNDFEFVVCCTSGGKLPWSDNTAMGHPPKWASGGEMSHRLSNGTRKNQRGGSPKSTGGERGKNGALRQAKPRPSHTFSTIGEAKVQAGGKVHTKNNGTEMTEQVYLPPKKANPGNVIRCNVGGGQMGSKLAHENEAPFPESLAEFFVRSFCPEGGVVLDPFCGSGTTLAVAKKNGRRFIGFDLRESQVELSRRRVQEINGPSNTEGEA